MCRISSSPKETVSRAPGLGNRKSCKNSTGEFACTRPGEGGREKARPVCSLSISSSSTSEPQVVASREAAISRGAAEALDARRGKMEAMKEETRARRLTTTKLHGTSPRGEQSSTEAVAEVQMDDCKKVSWVRNRNNEGQCDRFVKAEKSEEWMACSPV